MTPSRGNPILQIRLPQETHERLKDFVGKGDGGKAGGISLFVRRLIYRELREEMPAQWVKDGTEAVVESGILESLADLYNEIEMLARAIEADKPVNEERLQHLFEVSHRNSILTEDPIHKSTCEMMLGRLTVALMKKGTLVLRSDS